MEINRRDFVKLIVGGVAGIHVTPLPWKITDDIAIWTQNWSWVPVPEKGEFKEAKTICTLCPGGCGVRLRMVENRGIKIEGREDYPVNQGGICPVGMGGLQLLYDKDLRFTGPMKRVGPRGEGQFVDITWDEALGILTKRLSELRKEGKAGLVAAVDGLPYDGTESLLVRRFLEAYGSPNYYRMPDQEFVDRTINGLMHGVNGPLGFDLENSDYVLSFGAGLLEGWGSPGRILGLWGRWKGQEKGTKVKVVQVESRASNTASKADRWVAIRPGTEAALALGVVRELIKKGRYNVDFVNEFTFGFGDWVDQEGKTHKGLRSMVMEAYPPEKVSQITGVKPEEIAKIASDLEASKAPIAIWGKGSGGLPIGVYEAMAVNTINVVLGRVQRPGGVIVQRELPLGALPAPVIDEKAASSLKGKPRPAFVPFNGFVKAILEAKEPSIDTLMVFQANPLQTMPSASIVEKALRKIPFIVSFSPFRDDTACMADLILPDHVYLEKYQEMANPRGLGYAAYCVAAPVIRASFKSKAVGDTLIELAGALGGGLKDSFSFKNYEEVLKQRASGLLASQKGAIKVGKEPAYKWERPKDTGISGDLKKDWEALVKSNVWYVPNVSENQDMVFKTESKRIELFSLALKRSKEANLAGPEMAFMPHYEELAVAGDGMLLMPYEMVNWSSGWAPSPPYLTKTVFDNILLGTDLFLQINPRTARDLGLREGDYVDVESRLGALRMRVNLFEGAMPGVIYAPLGFGHVGYDEFIKGKGVNINRILLSKEDPVNGVPLWWGTKVRITRVSERG